MNNKTLKILVGIILLGLVGYIVLNANDAEKLQEEQSAREILADREQKKMEEELVELEKQVLLEDSVNKKFDLYKEIAEVSDNLHKVDATKVAYQEAIKLRPDNATVHTDYFDFLVKVGQYAEAEAEIKTAISLNSNSTRWKKYISLHKDNLKSGNEKVETLYNEAILMEPRDVEIVKAYAKFLEEIGYIGKSIEMWKKAISLNMDKKADYDLEIQRLRGVTP